MIVAIGGVDKLGVFIPFASTHQTMVERNINRSIAVKSQIQLPCLAVTIDDTVGEGGLDWPDIKDASIFAGVGDKEAGIVAG